MQKYPTTKMPANIHSATIGTAFARIAARTAHIVDSV